MIWKEFMEFQSILVTEKIENFCKKSGIESVGKIPYNPEFTKAMIEGKTIIEYNNDPVVKDMWKKIEERI